MGNKHGQKTQVNCHASEYRCRSIARPTLSLASAKNSSEARGDLLFCFRRRVGADRVSPLTQGWKLRVVTSGPVPLPLP